MSRLEQKINDLVNKKREAVKNISNKFMNNEITAETFLTISAITGQEFSDNLRDLCSRTETV